MDSAQQLATLKARLDPNQIPSDVMAKLTSELARIELLIKTSGYSLEADRLMKYFDLVVSLPWFKENQDILDLKRAQQILDKNHFGLASVKGKILEYLSVLVLNRQKRLPAHSMSLAFVGLVGSGKTSLAYSIAESLGRPIVRIPFGGLGSAAQLRGESRIRPESEPGLIIKALLKAQVKNPVILLDELDRVAEEARTDISGVLVEILDPEQNTNFLDHYTEVAFNLSEVLFVATANNLKNVSTAVLDRLEIIEMPFYSDDQKIPIAQNFLLPEVLKQAGVESSSLQIDPNVWLDLVRPLGFDGGIRSLKRTLEGMIRKVARQIVEGQGGPFVINSQTLAQYLS